MARDDAMKTILKKHLQACRNDLMWKLTGLSERDLRFPHTSTGLNLAGIVKHMANVEIGYFGYTFGRPWPIADEAITDAQFVADPQADWYVTENETVGSVLDFYQRVWDFADETIDTHALDTQGTVPHWQAEKAAVSLQQIMVHVIVDLARHVGQADIVRESIDGKVGLNPRSPNMPEGQDWGAYLSKLRALANAT